MELFDCPLFYNQPDVFATISDTDLKDLYFDVSERKIPFKPATTDEKLPIGAAFIALNAYVGNDYRSMFLKPNFIVSASKEHDTFVKLFNLMGIYQSGVPELEQKALYYTNFVKVVLPDHSFKKAEDVVHVLNRHNDLRSLFQKSLRTEIEELIKHGCRIFVCLGNHVSYYFKQALHMEPIVELFPLVRNVDGCVLHTRITLILSERHFSWYWKENTNSLIESLGTCIAAVDS